MKKTYRLSYFVDRQVGTEQEQKGFEPDRDKYAGRDGMIIVHFDDNGEVNCYKVYLRNAD